MVDDSGHLPGTTRVYPPNNFHMAINAESTCQEGRIRKQAPCWTSWGI